MNSDLPPPAKGGKNQHPPGAGNSPNPGNPPATADDAAKRAHDNSLSPNNPNRTGVTPTGPPAFNFNAKLAASNAASAANPFLVLNNTNHPGMDVDADVRNNDNANPGININAPKQLELSNLNEIAKTPKGSIPEVLRSIPLTQITKDVLTAAKDKFHDCIACPICGTPSNAKWPLHPEQKLFLCNNVYPNSGQHCTGNYTPRNMYLAIIRRTEKDLTAQFMSVMTKQLQEAFFQNPVSRQSNQYQSQLDQSNRLREEILSMNTDIMLHYRGKDIPDAVIKLIKLTKDYTSVQKILNSGLVNTLKNNSELSAKIFNTGLQIQRSNGTTQQQQTKNTTNNRQTAPTTYSKAAAIGTECVTSIIKNSTEETKIDNLMKMAISGKDPITNKSIEVRHRKPQQPVEVISSTLDIRNNWVREKVANMDLIGVRGYSRMAHETFRKILTEFKVECKNIVNLRHAGRDVWELLCDKAEKAAIVQFIQLSDGYSAGHVAIINNYNPLYPSMEDIKSPEADRAAIERLARNSVRPGVSSFASMAYQRYLKTDEHRKIYVEYCNKFINSRTSGGIPANQQ